MKDRKLAEVFPPGEFIREELEARGWVQDDLAEILGRPVRLVNEIITGRRGITPETAKGLGEAFGTGAEFWMNLESIYRLNVHQPAHEDVSRRAALYAKAPVRAMVKRSWIESSSNIDVLEKMICDFYGLDSLDDEPSLVHVARKSTSYVKPTPIQWAWLYRAVHLSKTLTVGKYSPAKLKTLLEQLKALIPHPQEIRNVPKLLAEAGIKFMIIEPLPQSKIDGVTFWMDDTPIIALSMRYDRIDYFWHTLSHELAGHVQNKDGKNSEAIVDIDLGGDEDSRPQYEIEADKSAVSYLIPQFELDNFIYRVGPLYSKPKIIQFANRIDVHPGIVVGQLQHPNRGEL
ncbi:MAG: addiction module antidote protein, HigA family, partial [Erysipelotrichaceae bacterium]|nr:addiction module antidote protein, HigA family [Erysipelotrichaceae bacterium]